MAARTCRASADPGTSSNNYVAFQRQLLLVLNLKLAPGYHSFGCDSKP